MKTRIILVVLFLTGFCSLVYELVWMRKLSLIFGASTLAVSTALSVFMAGLAFGSLYGGRFIEKSKQPYRFLAALQILIGIFCLITLFLIDGISHFYLSLFNILGEANFAIHLIHFVLSALILLPPTLLIGMVFPVAVKLYYHQQNVVGASVSKCYAVDTLGAASGVLATGFLLIWTIGLFKSSLTASIINILLGSLVAVSFGKMDNLRLPPPEPVNNQAITDRRILILFSFSGFAALTMEVVWIRFFEVIYGNSIISFAIVVASFLIGLGFGSFLAQFLIQRVKSAAYLFAKIELLIGITSLAILLLFPYLENLFLAIYFSLESYVLFIFLLGVVSICFLLIPTCLMGMTLPVLSAVYIQRKTVGSDIGRLFAVNSFGAIFGSFLAGFVFLYFLGLNNTAMMATFIYGAISIIFVWSYDRANLKRILQIASVSLVIVLGLFWFYYQPDYYYSGVYYHGTIYGDESYYFEYKRHTTPLYTKQSLYSFVSVVDIDGSTHVKINGRTEASTNEITQNLLAHLPLLFHKDPKTVINIGHGGGYTLNAVTLYPEVQSIDTVEIDRVIIEADKYIEDNGDPLSDSRVNLVIADGRNYLSTLNRKYDVIITESSHIWANGSFFTKDFYEIVKNSLEPDGIYCIWIPSYELSDQEFGILLNTIRSKFSHLRLFNFGKKDAIMILASQHAIHVPDDLIRERFDHSEVGRDFETIKKICGESDMTDEDFIKRAFHPGGFGIYSGGDRINTDDMPVLELATLRSRYGKFREY
jgi:spermidine synthase